MSSSSSITSSNIGPLTTTYTPPGTSCDSTFVAANDANTWLQRGSPGEDEQVSCLAPDWTRDEPVYYSPGICPYGFSSACGVGTASGSSTATATCCPSGYLCRVSTDLASNDPNLCLQHIATSTAETVLSHYFGNPQSEAQTYYTFETDTWVGARGVVVQRQDGDPTWALTAAVTTTDSSSGSVSPTSSSTSTPAASSTSDASASSPTSSSGAGSSDSGLSTGAKAGIGVGVALGVLAIIGIIIAAFYIGKRKRKDADAAAAAAAASQQPQQTSMSQQQQYAQYQQGQPGYGVPTTYTPSSGADGYTSTTTSPDQAWKDNAAGVHASSPEAGQYQYQQQYYQAPNSPQELDSHQNISEISGPLPHSELAAPGSTPHPR